MTTLFYMWEPLRESLIQGHLFYVEQSKNRLLSQFENLNAEADKYAEKWLVKRGHLFDPDRHDPIDLYEHAYDASIEFYQMLDDMRNRTLLSIVAGIFHEWDKQLRDWLVKEVMHWHSGEAVKQAIWKVNFDNIIDFVDMVLVKTKNTNHYELLDKYRLLVNAYKHGEGDSFKTLLSKHQEFFNPLFENQFEYGFFNYESIVVKDRHLDECSGAIVAFWKSIPNGVTGDQINAPVWFENAYKKDQKEC